MAASRSPDSRPTLATAWLLTAAGLALAVILSLAAPKRGPWGDEGTYLAMTASLARDRDLTFDEPDRDWALAQEPPATVVLQRVGERLSYSKPVLYPLLAAPLYAAIGGRGLVLLNLLLVAGAVVVAWWFLRRLGEGAAALTLVTFVGCGVLPFYLGWRMSDAALVALALAGSTLAAGALREERDGVGVAAAGGLLLGLVASMRFPGAALAAAPVLAGLVAGRPRRSLAIGLAAVIGFGGVSLAGLELAGTANPYKTARSSFSAATGYPTAPQEAGAERFESHPATQSATWLPRLEWTRSAYSALYSLIGRHTGLLVYFPAALVLVATALARPDRIGLVILLGPGAAGLFYLLWMPENWFGGSTFIGNRYFLMAYPALLAALPRLPRARWLAAAWLVGLVAGSSALVSMRAAGGEPSSQSHAAAGLFRLLPGETTAQKVDGHRARFWARDFVRFTDPFARVEEEAFFLAAGAPAAELELAFRVPRDTLRLEVIAPGVGERLRYSDWRGSGVVLLDPGSQVIELPLSPAWRWHTYWWQAPDVYQVRTLRLAVEPAVGGESGAPPATVELRNLGGPWRPPADAG